MNAAECCAAFLCTVEQQRAVCNIPQVQRWPIHSSGRGPGWYVRRQRQNRVGQLDRHAFRCASQPPDATCRPHPVCMQDQFSQQCNNRHCTANDSSAYVPLTWLAGTAITKALMGEYATGFTDLIVWGDSTYSETDTQTVSLCFVCFTRTILHSACRGRRWCYQACYMSA